MRHLGSPNPKFNTLRSSPSWCHQVLDDNCLIVHILNAAGHGQGTPYCTGLELCRSEYETPGKPKPKVQPALIKSELVPPSSCCKLFNCAHIKYSRPWRGSALLHRSGVLQERIYDTWEAQTQSSTRSDRVRAGATRFLMQTIQMLQAVERECFIAPVWNFAGANI
jgi:hypothetical protein